MVIGMDYTKLLDKAKEMRKMSYVPYSHFHVGAALLTKDGKIYGGCNIENASYGATNCAERTAFFSAIAQGDKEFQAIAIVGGPEDENGNIDKLTDAQPCGICRQVMREFCGPDFEIVLEGADGKVTVQTLSEMLPNSFGPENL
jgi:cytidine deaminase